MQPYITIHILLSLHNSGCIIIHHISILPLLLNTYTNPALLDHGPNEFEVLAFISKGLGQTCQTENINLSTIGN